jgi:predicted dinucleotide-binding enzyme
MSYAIVGFGAVGQALARAFARKNIDVTVASRRPPEAPEELGGLPSSAVVAKAFTGAKLVKGFNHLIAATLAADPTVEGGHRVIFLSSDDEDAITPVAALAKRLGFAPVKLGKLNEGGALVHARDRTWGQLIFQDLFKKEQ